MTVRTAMMCIIEKNNIEKNATHMNFVEIFMQIQRKDNWREMIDWNTEFFFGFSATFDIQLPHDIQEIWD